MVEQLEIHDALFRLMSAVLLPEGQIPGADPVEPDGTRPTGLDILAASLRYAELHPDRKLLISGHTDTSGGDQYNVNLSEFRAGAVHAVLVNGDGCRDAFGDICNGPHLQGKQKKQDVMLPDRVQVLNWVAANFGWGCATTGEYGSYLHATKVFQSSYNECGKAGNSNGKTLTVDGDFGPSTWRAVFDCYQAHLAATLKISLDELRSLQSKVNGQFVNGAVPSVGCGEYKPIDQVGRDNYRSPTNRRVEVMFFAPGNEPETPCLSGKCDPAACELYDRTWYRRKRLPVRIVDREFRVRLHDSLGRFMPGEPWKALVSGATYGGISDADSWATINIDRSACFAPIPFEWGSSTEGGFRYQRVLIVECAGTELQVAAARLHNIGYSCDPTNRSSVDEAVRFFQRDYRIREPLGLDDEKLRPLTQQRLDRIYGEDRCNAEPNTK